jgi:hypothetical protein
MRSEDIAFLEPATDKAMTPCQGGTPRAWRGYLPPTRNMEGRCTREMAELMLLS